MSFLIQDLEGYAQYVRRMKVLVSSAILRDVQIMLMYVVLSQQLG